MGNEKNLALEYEISIVCLIRLVVFNNIFNTGQVEKTSSLDYPRVVAEYIYEDIICTESVMDVQAIIGQIGLMFI